MTKWRINPKTGELEEAYLFSGWQIIKGVFWFLVIASIYSCYDETIGKSIDISDVKKYCSADQLLKTGQAKCTEVKWKLSQRYNTELIRDKDTLEDLKSKTSHLLQNKQEKCNQSGLQAYGTEGCTNATNDLKQNQNRIANLVEEIKQKHQRITEMQLLQLYKVTATSLNVRKCEQTNCQVITQLQKEEEIYISKDTNDEWVQVQTNKGSGYAMKKYLTPISNSEIEVNVNSLKNTNSELQEIESSQQLTTDFREVNWGKSSYQDIINMINAGADINQIYEEGTTVLMLAIDMGANPQAIQALIDKGANVNVKNDNEYTVLHMSAYQNNPQVIEILVKNGADINSTDFSGMTPLMLASKDNKNPNIIEALIKAGADVNKKSSSDMNALDYAAYGNQNPKILETLIKHGATIEESTLNWAKENENQEIQIFLKKNAEKNKNDGSSDLWNMLWAILLLPLLILNKQKNKASECVKYEKETVCKKNRKNMTFKEIIEQQLQLDQEFLLFFKKSLNSKQETLQNSDLDEDNLVEIINELNDLRSELYDNVEEQNRIINDYNNNFDLYAEEIGIEKLSQKINVLIESVQYKMENIDENITNILNTCENRISEKREIKKSVLLEKNRNKINQMQQKSESMKEKENRKNTTDETEQNENTGRFIDLE